MLVGAVCVVRRRCTRHLDLTTETKQVKEPSKCQCNSIDSTSASLESKYSLEMTTSARLFSSQSDTDEAFKPDDTAFAAYIQVNGLNLFSLLNFVRS